MQWEKVELIQDNKYIFIRNIKLYPLKLTVSYKSTGKRHENLVSNFYNALDVTLKNVDRASVYFFRYFLN